MNKMKIKPLWYGVMMNLVLGAAMALCVSLVLVLVSLGPVPGFLGIWLKSALTAFIVAFPVSLLVAPWAQRLLSSLFEVQP